MAEVSIPESGDGFARLVLRLPAEVDLASAALITDAANLASHHGRMVLVVDGSEVTSFDPQGVRAFVAARAVLQPPGGSLVLENASPALLQVLDLAGVEDLDGLELAP